MATNEEAAMMVGLSEAGTRGAAVPPTRVGGGPRASAPGPAQAQGGGAYMMPGLMVPGNYVAGGDAAWGANMAAMMGHGAGAGHTGMQSMMGQAVAVPYPVGQIVEFKDQEIYQLKARLAEKDAALKQHQTNLHSLQTQNKKLQAQVQDLQNQLAAAKSEARDAQDAPTAALKDTAPLSEQQAATATNKLLQDYKKEIETLRQTLSSERAAAAALGTSKSGSASGEGRGAGAGISGSGKGSELSAADRLLFERGKQALHVLGVFKAGLQLLDSDASPLSLGPLGPLHTASASTSAKARGRSAPPGRLSSAAFRVNALDDGDVGESEEEVAAKALLQTVGTAGTSGAGTGNVKGFAARKAEQGQDRPKAAASSQVGLQKGRFTKQRPAAVEGSGRDEAAEETEEGMVWCIPNQARGAPPSWMADYMVGLYSGQSDASEHGAELRPASEVSSRWVQYREDWARMQKKREAKKAAKQEQEGGQEDATLSSARAALTLASAAQGGLGFALAPESSKSARGKASKPLILSQEEDSEDDADSQDDDGARKQVGRARTGEDKSGADRTRVKDRWVNFTTAAHVECPFPDCTTVFKNPDFVVCVQHVQDAHTKGSECELCDFSSTKRELLRSHVIAHANKLMGLLTMKSAGGTGSGARAEQKSAAKPAPMAQSSASKPSSSGPTKRLKQEAPRNDDDDEEGSSAVSSDSEGGESDHKGEYIQRFVDGKRRVFCPVATCEFNRAHPRDLHSHIRDLHRELLKCACGAKTDTVRQIKLHQRDCPKANKEKKAGGTGKAASPSRSKKADVAPTSQRAAPAGAVTVTGKVTKSGAIECAYPDCDGVFSAGAYDRAFRAHARSRHDVSAGGTWYICVEPGCDFYSLSKQALQGHLVDHEKVSVMQAAGRSMPTPAAKPALEAGRGREIPGTAALNSARGGPAVDGDRGKEGTKAAGDDSALRPCPWPGCEKRYTKLSKSDFNYHLQEEHVTGRVCSYPRCGMEFKSREGAKGHILLAHGFKIDMEGAAGGMSNLDKKGGNGPVRKSAGEDEAEGDASDTEMTKYHCIAPDCTFYRLNAGDTERHFRLKHPELMQCSACGHEYKKMRDIEAHAPSCAGAKAGGVGQGVSAGGTGGTTSTETGAGVVATSARSSGAGTGSGVVATSARSASAVPASPMRAAAGQKRKRNEDGSGSAPASAARTASRKAPEVTVIDDDDDGGVEEGAHNMEVAEPEEFMAGAS